VPAHCVTEFYALDDQLLPIVSELERRIMPGDYVLAVDYFGRPASMSIDSLVKKRPDVGWIQDCAHALDGPACAWGDWQIYSPRKLLGVADGGIAMSVRKPLPSIDFQRLQDQSFTLPSIERLEDREGTQNVDWYAHYREAEAHMQVGLVKMSELAVAVMRTVSVSTDRHARIRNYGFLHQRLARNALFKDNSAAFTPLGYPIVVDSAGLTSERLARNGIFAARHWADLPSDAVRFKHEHDLSRRLLTIPCDYRYGEADMQHVADEVERALRG
jgi:dTDP-4-amino-4,6-dideoxygalactose transaminase